MQNNYGAFKLELEKELSGISCQDSFPGYKLEDHHSISDIKIQQKTNLDDSSNATIGVFWRYATSNEQLVAMEKKKRQGLKNKDGRELRMIGTYHEQGSRSWTYIRQAPFELNGTEMSCHLEGEMWESYPRWRLEHTSTHSCHNHPAMEVRQTMVPIWRLCFPAALSQYELWGSCPSLPLNVSGSLKHYVC